MAADNINFGLGAVVAKNPAGQVAFLDHVQNFSAESAVELKPQMNGVGQTIRQFSGPQTGTLQFNARGVGSVERAILTGAPLENAVAGAGLRALVISGSASYRLATIAPPADLTEGIYAIRYEGAAHKAQRLGDLKTRGDGSLADIAVAAGITADAGAAFAENDNAILYIIPGTSAQGRVSFGRAARKAVEIVAFSDVKVSDSGVDNRVQMIYAPAAVLANMPVSMESGAAEALDLSFTLNLVDGFYFQVDDYRAS